MAYSLDYHVEGKMGEALEGPFAKELSGTFATDKDAICHATSFEVGTILFPNLNKPDIGVHRVVYSVLKDGNEIAAGEDDRFKFGSEFPSI